MSRVKIMEVSSKVGRELVMKGIRDGMIEGSFPDRESGISIICVFQQIRLLSQCLQLVLF